MPLFRGGSWKLFGVKLPEFGITETIGSTYGAPRTKQGGSQLFLSPQEYQTQIKQPQERSLRQYSAIPAVQGVADSRSISPFGSQGGTTQPVEQPQTQQQPQQQGQQQTFEQAPEQPNMSFVDELLNPALSTLDTLEAETRSLLGGGEQQAEQFTTTAEAKAREAKQAGLLEVEKAETRAQTSAKEAEAQQRRGFSEIQQSLLGRFGRSGFGQGVIGSIGESTLQTLGRIRVGLQETINDLNIRKNQLEDIFNSSVQEAQFEAENLKQNARAQLQQALSQIGQSRIGLATRKAEMVNAALENYRQAVQAVNARNTAFQQQLETMRVEAQNRIAQAQTRAQQVSSNLPNLQFKEFQGQPYSFNPQNAELKPIAGFGGTELGAGGTTDLFGGGLTPEEQYDELLRQQGVIQ